MVDFEKILTPMEKAQKQILRDTDTKIHLLAWLPGDIFVDSYKTSFGCVPHPKTLSFKVGDITFSRSTRESGHVSHIHIYLNGSCSCGKAG